MIPTSACSVNSYKFCRTKSVSVVFGSTNCGKLGLATIAFSILDKKLLQLWISYCCRYQLLQGKIIIQKKKPRKSSSKSPRATLGSTTLARFAKSPPTNTCPHYFQCHSLFPSVLFCHPAYNARYANTSRE